MVVSVLKVMSQSSTSHTLRMAALGFRKKPLARIWGVGRRDVCVLVEQEQDKEQNGNETNNRMKSVTEWTKEWEWSLYLQYELSEGEHYKDEIHRPYISGVGKDSAPLATCQEELSHLGSNGNQGHYEHDPGEVGETTDNVAADGVCVCVCGRDSGHVWCPFVEGTVGMCGRDGVCVEGTVWVCGRDGVGVWKGRCGCVEGTVWVCGRDGVHVWKGWCTCVEGTVWVCGRDGVHVWKGM